MFRFAQSIIRLATLAGALALVVSPAAASGPSFPSQNTTYTPRNAPLYTPRASYAPYSPRPDAFSSRSFDGGGNVMEYFANSRMAEYGSGHTVIAGVCASACTMKLGASNVCIEADATLMFHEASADGNRSELATRIMLDAYPSGIRSWVVRSGALNSTSLTELSGRQAIALGIRACRA